MWKVYALMAAVFAALTAIFSKMGVENVESNLATAIRVSFILLLVWGIITFTGQIQDINHISKKSWLFLLLSALTTGLSWLCYFKALSLADVSRVAPIDKLSVPLTILIAIIFLGENASWQVIAGGTLITLGTLILLL